MNSIRNHETTSTMLPLGRRARGAYERLLSRFCFRRLAVMHNTTPLISFTFDDFPQSALHGGGAILKAHNLRGTYYASLGLMGRQAPVGTIFSRDDLQTVLAEGHELGCHTYGHCHSWNTPPRQFERSVVENECVLKQLIPHASFRTLAYPISGPRPGTKRRMNKHFACCRGGGQTFNLGTMDLNNVKALFLEKCQNNSAFLAEIMKENAERNGWLIFATHDVAEEHSRFGCAPRFFEEIVRQALKSGATILPVAEALDVITDVPKTTLLDPATAGSSRKHGACW